MLAPGPGVECLGRPGSVGSGPLASGVGVSVLAAGPGVEVSGTRSVGSGPLAPWPERVCWRPGRPGPVRRFRGGRGCAGGGAGGGGLGGRFGGVRSVGFRGGSGCAGGWAGGGRSRGPGRPRSVRWFPGSWWREARPPEPGRPVWDGRWPSQVSGPPGSGRPCRGADEPLVPGSRWAPQRPRPGARAYLGSRPRRPTLPRGRGRVLTTPRASSHSRRLPGSPGWCACAVGLLGVVLDGPGVVHGDVVLELVARHEPALAVRALMHVIHCPQCRAATFPAGGRPRGHKGTLRWASATVESRS